MIDYITIIVNYAMESSALNNKIQISLYENMIETQKMELNNLQSKLLAAQKLQQCYQFLYILNDSSLIIAKSELELLKDTANLYGIELTTQFVEILITLVYSGYNKESDLTDKSKWKILNLQNKYVRNGKEFNYDYHMCSTTVSQGLIDVNDIDFEIDWETGIDCDGGSWTYSAPTEMVAQSYHRFIEVSKVLTK